MVLDAEGKVKIEDVVYGEMSNYEESSKFDSGITDSYGWSNKSWSYPGYGSLDDLYNKQIIAIANAFNHEDSVEETGEN